MTDNGIGLMAMLVAVLYGGIVGAGVVALAWWLT